MSQTFFPSDDPAARAGVPQTGRHGGRLRTALRSSITGTVGGLVFLLMCLAALILPWFVEVPPADSNLVYTPPSAEYPLGTDADGRDVFTMILLGGRDVIIVSVLSATVSTGIAVVLGALAAYLRGWVDSLVIQLTDFMLTIPQFALLVVLAAYVRMDSPVMLALLLGALGWPGLLRAVRAQVLSLKEREYVEAARIVGLSTPVIIGREILPNMASYLMIHFIFAMTGATYSMVGLYLLGLAPMTGINWGIMINNAWAKGALFFTNAAWSIMAPLLVVSVLQLSAIWFARTLEQLLNPRLAGQQQ
ncbi:ABC transporter permease [Tessaracoccus sp. OH4464_COT-324]|uniref:ABC transporter permease n=1 Tax=Tessaracoccus sp. OH4464_COT-324 TaxID=2491059 RepID=UPI000F635B3A|nr:ABC transporter permease [Tessaracoccus sp. OH4464_COT-324]RRD45877.1 ABC transporter permease [Tessaracoccus sp. OH4464_COT-324]